MDETSEPDLRLAVGPVDTPDDGEDRNGIEAGWRVADCRSDEGADAGSGEGSLQDS